jgi:anti-sigma regulatory factor (Ser/Thr protein kinase)
MVTPDDPPLLCLESVIDASLDGMSDVHRMLADFWQQVAQCPVAQPDATWRALFESAAAEVAGNVVRHAYPSSSTPMYFRLALCCFDNRIVATTLDQGIPWELPIDIPAPNMEMALEDDAFDGGWGLPIAHAVTDGLGYQRLADGYNQWRIDKFFVKR